jgi:hypothetical protein
MNRDHYEICEGIFLAILNGYVKFKEFTVYRSLTYV